LTAAKCRPPKPRWTQARIRHELEEFLQGATEWPSYRDFQRAGRQKLRDEVTRSGGPRLWAKRLGLPYLDRKPGYAPVWTEERVRADLEEFLHGWTHWPSRLEFEAAGHKLLRDAVRRLGGPERWAGEFGLPLQNLKFGSRRAWTEERIEAELGRLLAGREAWPTRREIERFGSFGLAAAVEHRGGAAYWARRMGLEPPLHMGISRPRIWTDERIRAELEEFCRARATWPTEREFLQAGKAPLYCAACKYRGPRYWAAQLGLIRVRRHGPAPGIPRPPRDEVLRRTGGDWSTPMRAIRAPLPSHLLAELHPNRNPDIDPSTISAGSRRRVWWRCPRGHEWQARVDNRSAGTGCPYCAGTRVAFETSLAAAAPAIAVEWHPSRNGKRTPATTMPGSDRPVWWRCERGHEWLAAPHARVGRGTGCPYCAGKCATEPRSLAALYPGLTAELHPTRNGGLVPSALLPGSPRRVWWHCPNGHEWQAPVRMRVKVGTGCPKCASQEQRGVPLEAARPDLVSEWNAVLNGGPPGGIAAGSHKRVWWRCSVDASHLWRASIRNRVRNGSGCPYCAGKRATPAHCLQSVAPQLAAEWHPERNASLSPSDVLPYSRRKVWWRCTAGHEWDARPANRMLGTGCPECAKRRRGSESSR
jgi:hypothetical protein